MPQFGASNQCLFNRDCPTGLDCVDGQCRQACFDDNGCVPGDVCVERYCLDPAAMAPECAMNAECPDGGRCVNGRCE